ncbi:transcriptional regulator [Arthrobacter sp. MYb224]|uniref:ArsR/SmtB family transcription factor n=1 Tax=Arthrobacter sp. MYb224 TaxID=1848600 RepID=UPI000CFB970B|nr:metalloregulator ArsR/SmtB family transcription factor [Arthrobacter sp. MYb224]PRA01089.1 transcriptional regulator [Arthrobacter sp. MYb224]
MTSEYTGLPAREDIISNDLLDMSMTILKTLSDPARLQMLWALTKAEHSLSELSQFVGVSPTVAGQLLTRLRTTGVLQTRKSGRHVIYSMQDERLKKFIGQTLDFAEYRLRISNEDESAV